MIKSLQRPHQTTNTTSTNADVSIILFFSAFLFLAYISGLEKPPSTKKVNILPRDKRLSVGLSIENRQRDTPHSLPWNAPVGPPLQLTCHTFFGRLGPYLDITEAFHSSLFDQICVDKPLTWSPKYHWLFASPIVGVTMFKALLLNYAIWHKGEHCKRHKTSRKVKQKYSISTESFGFWYQKINQAIQVHECWLNLKIPASVASSNTDFP